MILHRLSLVVLGLVAEYHHLARAASRLDNPFPGARTTHSEPQHALKNTATTPSGCNLTGVIEATQCDYETVAGINDDLYNKLHTLVDTPFFKYIKLDLTRECPFWEDNGFCVLRDCAVTTVDESEIPPKWRAASLSQIKRPHAEDLRNAFPGCYYSDSDFCVLDDDSSVDSRGEYVDLSLNPERFTGYAGMSAHRVWKAIYEENCFGLSEDTFNTLPDPFKSVSPARPLSPMGTLAQQVADEEVCLEKKVYYRIISGLHASISMHVCHESLDQKTGEWCFIDRIVTHPERLQHIYFNTVLLLRAVSRAGAYLASYDLQVAERNDEGGKQLLGDIINVANVVGAFDESALFKGDDANFLRNEFKHHFRNVTRIMDCVGCDKCRLWGKIQTTGLGTALKILFELDEKALDPKINPHLLQRFEVVALLNTLHRFSESLRAVSQFRQMWEERDSFPSPVPALKENPLLHGNMNKLDSHSSPPAHSSSPPKPSSPHPSTPNPSPSSAPSSPSSTLVAESVQRIQALWKTCQRNTVTCLHFGLSIVERLAQFLSSLFQLSGKDDVPRPDL